MRFSGRRRYDVPRDQLWAALHDPEVLARTLPGCEAFRAVDDTTYAGTLTLGAAGARGAYRGTIEEADIEQPASYRLLVRAAGTPGSVEANTRVELDDEGDATLLRYEVDATIGGSAGAMGMHLLAAAADRTAATFLDALADALGGTDTDEDAPDVSAEADGPTSPADHQERQAPDRQAPDRQAPASPVGGPAGDDVAGGTRPDATDDGRGGRLRRWVPALLGLVVAGVAVVLGRRSGR